MKVTLTLSERETAGQPLEVTKAQKSATVLPTEFRVVSWYLVLSSSGPKFCGCT